MPTTESEEKLAKLAHINLPADDPCARFFHLGRVAGLVAATILLSDMEVPFDSVEVLRKYSIDIQDRILQGGLQ